MFSKQGREETEKRPEKQTRMHARSRETSQGGRHTGMHPRAQAGTQAHEHMHVHLRQCTPILVGLMSAQARIHAAVELPVCTCMRMRMPVHAHARAHAPHMHARTCACARRLAGTREWQRPDYFHQSGMLPRSIRRWTMVRTCARGCAGARMCRRAACMHVRARAAHNRRHTRGR